MPQKRKVYVGPFGAIVTGKGIVGAAHGTSCTSNNYVLPKIIIYILKQR